MLSLMSQIFALFELCPAYRWWVHRHWAMIRAFWEALLVWQALTLLPWLVMLCLLGRSCRKSRI